MVSVHCVTIFNMNVPPSDQLMVFAYETKVQAIQYLSGLLDIYGIPFEVWRALHSVMADEALPCAQKGMLFDLIEAFVDG